MRQRTGAPQATLPIVATAASSWLLQDPRGDLARDAALLWGGAIPCVLPGSGAASASGRPAARILAMLWLVLLGVTALAMLAFRLAPALLLGNASPAILDPLGRPTGQDANFGPPASAADVDPDRRHRRCATSCTRRQARPEPKRQTKANRD